MTVTSPYNWAAARAQFAALAAEPLTVHAVPEWLHRWSNLSKEFWEARAVLKAVAARDPADETAQSAFGAFNQQNTSAYMAAQEPLTARLLALEGFEPAADLVQLMRRMRNESGLFREENVAILAKVSALQSEFTTIFGVMQATVDGENISFGQATACLRDPDRSVREAAWRGIDDRWQEDHQQIGELVLKLVTLWREIARNAGLADFRAYSWRELNRLDYTPDDCFAFHDAVEAEILPLARALGTARQDRLGVASRRPWDLVVDPESRPALRPFASVSELEEGVTRILTRIDPEFGDLFARMRDGWLDLAPVSGKPLGGEEWYFMTSGMPYIVSNAVGTHDNVLTAIHESGHAVHDYLSRHRHDLIWNGGAPDEFAELVANAMIFLADPYLERDRGGFYTAALANQGRVNNIAYYVRFLLQVCMVDDFQHWLFTTSPEGLTVDDLDSRWLAIAERFDDGLDWSGLERQRAAGWLYYTFFHVSNPFYFLGYGLSLLGAVQVWRNAQDNQASAVRLYKEALCLGDTKSLPQLFEAAGAKLPFDRATVRDAARFMAAYLHKAGALSSQ